jgi:hypothetical protein
MPRGRTLRRPDLEVSDASVVGLICSEPVVSRLPVHPWAIDAALVQLAVAVEAGSVLHRAMQRWPHNDRTPGLRFLGLHSLLWGLAAAGHIVPSGEGSAAHYTISPEWRLQHRALHNVLSAKDRLAVRGAAMYLAYLVAKSTTRSNNSVSAESVRSAASS